MKLFTSLPARKTGTLNVTTRDGTTYKFSGAPLSCEIEDEDHAEELRDLENFQTEDEFKAEQAFQKQAADREARRSARGGRGATGSSASDEENDDDELNAGSGLPLESNTPPTGRVRKASTASVVTGK